MRSSIDTGKQPNRSHHIGHKRHSSSGPAHDIIKSFKHERRALETTQSTGSTYYHGDQEGQYGELESRFGNIRQGL